MEEQELLIEEVSHFRDAEGFAGWDVEAVQDGLEGGGGFWGRLGFVTGL